MPLISMNMAVPLGNRIYSHRDSQVMILSNPQVQNVTPPPRRLFRRYVSMYLVLKAMQLIFSMASLVFFASGIESAKYARQLDLLIFTVYGALLFYPIIYFIFSGAVNEKINPWIWIVLNICATFVCFFIGLHAFFTWSDMESGAETAAVLHLASKRQFRPKNSSIWMCFATFLLSCSNGLFYFIETLLIYLEIKGYI